MYTKQSWQGMINTLRPSTLAGLVYDLGWALDEGLISKAEWAFFVKMALNKLVTLVGVDAAREMVGFEAGLVPEPELTLKLVE